MQLQKTPINDLCIITLDRFSDDRGYFIEIYNDVRYQKIIKAHFLQDNVSQSKKGVLRGLHFQIPPFAQGKLVTVLQGAVYDVAVDLRRKSTTYGQWFGVELTSENKKQFWIPEGFAHGFLTLEDNTIFSYKCTQIYAPQQDSGLVWNDDQINIDWKLKEYNIMKPFLSKKDETYEAFNVFVSPF